MSEDNLTTHDPDAPVESQASPQAILRAIGAFLVVGGVFVLVPQVLDAETCCEVYAATSATLAI